MGEAGPSSIDVAGLGVSLAAACQGASKVVRDARLPGWWHRAGLPAPVPAPLFDDALWEGVREAPDAAEVLADIIAASLAAAASAGGDTSTRTPGESSGAGGTFTGANYTIAGAAPTVPTTGLGFEKDATPPRQPAISPPAARPKPRRC
jgi:hypothetical protein